MDSTGNYIQYLVIMGRKERKERGREERRRGREGKKEREKEREGMTEDEMVGWHH